MHRLIMKVKMFQWRSLPLGAPCWLAGVLLTCSCFVWYSLVKNSIYIIIEETCNGILGV
jgi:hypothetical protein